MVAFKGFQKLTLIFFIIIIIVIIIIISIVIYHFNVNVCFDAIITNVQMSFGSVCVLWVHIGRLTRLFAARDHLGGATRNGAAASGTHLRCRGGVAFLLAASYTRPPFHPGRALPREQTEGRREI